MAQVSVFSPWKDASHGVPSTDTSVMMYVKNIADTGAAGGQVDQADVAVVVGVDTITFRYREVAGALAGDADINSYTGATGAVGTITTVDGNANSIQEQINVVNGVAVGQTATRRWRAAVGDLPPPLATVAADYLVRGATNALVGEWNAGVPLFNDSSTAGAMAANDIWVGIGTNRGTIAGSGARWADYFEDIPGASTTAGVNTPQRSPSAIPRKANEAVTRQLQYRITGFTCGASHATTNFYCVHDIWNNVLWVSPLALAAPVVFQDLSNTPIVGPIGSPLFFRKWGTGVFVDGAVYVRAEVRAV